MTAWEKFCRYIAVEAKKIGIENGRPAVTEEQFNAYPEIKDYWERR